MTGQRIDLDIDPNAFSLHCPVCGSWVVRPEAEPSPCAHCTFVWFDGIGEFDEANCTPDIIERMKVIPPPEERVDENDFDWVSCFDEQFLGKLPDGTIAFFLTWSGMACGPYSETVVVGFDCTLVADSCTGCGPAVDDDDADEDDAGDDDEAGEEWKRGSSGTSSAEHA
ncbi:MAG: hypothetical protein FJ298_07050 [Planctomycetes bacterium]|nr:hypothetical protein [Planctomycetota bacterium]